MIITVQAIVKDNVLENELLSISDIYDPKGYLTRHNDKVVVADLKLRISKKGNFVAIVDGIREI